MPAATQPVPPPRRSRHPGALLGRAFLFLLGSLILLFAVLLPYRVRIAFSDIVGRSMNWFYHSYLRLLRWFFRKLEEE